MIRSFHTAAIVLCCAFSLLSAVTTITVNKDIAKVLLLPYGDAKTLGFVKKGEVYTVVNKKNDWYYIDFQNIQGWVFEGNVTENILETPVAKPEKPETDNVDKKNKVVKQVPPPQKTEPTAEQIESKLLPSPPQIKQKKQEPLSIDLPPASITSTDNDNSHSSRSTINKNQNHPIDSFSGIPRLNQRIIQNLGTLSSKDSTKLLNGEEVSKFFEINESSAKILASVSPQATVLGMARNGDCFVLLFAGQSWCKIRYLNAEGWVERRLGRIVDTPTMTKKLPRIILLVVSIAGGVFLIVFFLVFFSLSLRNKSAKRISVKKDMLLIAHSEKQVHYSLTDSTTTLSKCFSEIGFKTSFASDMDHARNMLLHYLPDVIVVDWQLGSNVLLAIESILKANRTSMANKIIVIFYNVPDVSAVPQSKVIPNVEYLGLSFSDRDIFKLVTPLILSGAETKSIRKSVETSALGGEIGQGNLIEVLQFIEIGRKTGCLYIVLDKPLGLIYFENGRLTYATTQSKQGREAIFEILGLTSGQFHFVLDKVSHIKNVNMSTLEILMEWTKDQDEAHRN